MSDELLGSLGVTTQNFKALGKEMISAHCQMGRYVLKILLLHHDVKDLDWFWDLEIVKQLQG